MTAKSGATATSAADSSSDDVRIRLHGSNISITDSMRDYVEAKLGKVFRKHANLCSKVDVHLSVEHNASSAKNTAEVVVFIGKTIIRRQVRSADSESVITALSKVTYS
jgi:putative sigma-54 modulation protein